jgi:hypothetical protein
MSCGPSVSEMDTASTGGLEKQEHWGKRNGKSIIDDKSFLSS